MLPDVLSSWIDDVGIRQLMEEGAVIRARKVCHRITMNILVRRAADENLPVKLDDGTRTVLGIQLLSPRAGEFLSAARRNTPNYPQEGPIDRRRNE